MAADDKLIAESASESLAVAPPPPGGAEGAAARAGATPNLTESASDDAGAPAVREAIDASDDATLARDPGNEDAKLDVALDETFPTSDPPSNTQPGRGLDPAPSSGFDAEAERARQADQH